MAALNKTQMQVWSRSQVYEPNTFIGGVANSSVPDAATLAQKLGIQLTDIKSFRIVGNDIECYIGVYYDTTIGAFQNDSEITYYRDEGGRLKNIGAYTFNMDFTTPSKFKEFKGLGVETIGKRAFRNAEVLEKCITGSYLWKLSEGVWSRCTLLSEVDISYVTVFEDGGDNILRQCLNLPPITFNQNANQALGITFFQSIVNGVDLGGITSLGGGFQGTFQRATIIQETLYSDNIESVDDNTFMEMDWNAPSTVKTINFPNCLTLGVYVFSSNQITVHSLENVLLPKVEEIGVGAFASGARILYKEIDIRSATTLADSIFHRAHPTAATTFQSGAIIKAHQSMSGNADLLWAKAEGVTVQIYDNNGDYLYDL